MHQSRRKKRHQQKNIKSPNVTQRTKRQLRDLTHKSNNEIPKCCEGKVVYVLGGGPSLKDFDFSFLRNKTVLGANDSYLLNQVYDAPIVNYIMFGDHAWFTRHHGKDTVEKQGKKYQGVIHFEGLLFSNASLFIEHPKVTMLKRKVKYFGDDPRFTGWFYSTGASAVHLACQMGASKVVLLGFDMKPTGNKSHNYYVNLKTPFVEDKTIQRHKRGMGLLQKTKLGSPYSSIPILNAGPDSSLTCFPKTDLSEGAL